MKKFFLFCILSFSVLFTKAQNPVSWTFTAKKLADKKYEIHLTASVQTGWHLYSQVQPEDAVVNPTDIKFNANPLLVLEGKITETGKVEKFHDEKLGISANQYAGSVDFVQVVKLKAKAKTNLAGIVEFQTCDDKKCLPPKKVNFSIALN
ncbi:MAG: protein-disulfide reductase DsbD domain-containing protein [Bacteroidota bacterium]